MWHWVGPAALLVIIWIVHDCRQRQRWEHAGETSQQTVSVIIPALNEAKVLGESLSILQQLDPPPHEVIIADGDSSDSTVEVARRGGAKVVNVKRGRAVQMNAGAAAATGDILCFLHADSTPPRELVAACRRVLADPRTVLGGFRTLIRGTGGRLLKFMTCHHLVKTFYLVILARPGMFLNGGICLFGDQTMFCRAEDFRAAGGFDESLPIMEDVQLCITMHEAGPVALNRPEASAAGRRSGSSSNSHTNGSTEVSCRSSSSRLHVNNGGGGRERSGRTGRRVRGRVRLVWWPPAVTSGRRLEALGNLQATRIHFTIGLGWYLGVGRERLIQMYRTMYSDRYR